MSHSFEQLKIQIHSPVDGRNQSRDDLKVVVATIDRPEALNALNEVVLRSFAALMDWLDGQADVRALILTGAGDKAFVAGADIKQFENLTPDSAERFASQGQAIFSRLEMSRYPVIAAVNGFALGGGLELALACDFIYASDTAKFGLPECTLGLMPGYGGTVRLPRRVGPALAREMAMTGSMITAQDALACGLVNKIFSSEALLPKAVETAGLIASRAPLAISMIKASIHKGASMTAQDAEQLEARYFGKLFASADRTEGVQAFLEKRKPRFNGS